MTAPAQPVGVVLAGGASSRMGTDKAFVEVGGRPMVRIVADALEAGGCAPIRCQGGTAPALAALGLEVWPDPEGRRGPVRAIRDALASADAPAGTVIAACDLPGLEGRLVRALLAARDASGRVAVAVADGRRHLVAAWPAGCAGDVARLVDDGVTSYTDLLERLGAVEVAADGAALRNVNRPADLP